ncbi:Uncharacterized conserved protein, DUF1697 family [Propionibacterium cyclohexanicum]|uniref:Uncharacterized conserved protein, DUF1697 family n=1 Tax=Propionibacterium cyclohexanicum TaxID=64702 RepID=A0A1H9TPK2_9ACTN|nr:DUF1697 domain-containing protein [Propionibacterium cyclohexanicum]SER98839.1 Uncharacterized conserved protein, DUF1697 family [Propionibacterium cyclohexanicum]
MSRWALLLRGVNVGGLTIVMSELRSLLTGIGTGGVTTWLASGNVALDWPGDGESLADAASAALAARYGRPVRLVVMDFDELADVVAHCPFVADPQEHRYVIVCEDDDVATRLVRHAVPGDGPVEEFSARGRVVYWRCPKNSTLTTPFARHQARFTDRARTTARNLNTLEKMLR